MKTTFRAAAVLALTVGVILATATCGGRGEGGDTAAPTLVLRGGWLFTGQGDAFEPNEGLLIRDSIVVALHADLADADIAGARVIDLTEDDYIIPGLFDLHAHYAVDLLGNGRVDETEVYPGLFLANGVTSTFPAGEVSPYRMRDARIAIDKGEKVGPRIFSSGPYFGSAREGWDADAISRDSLRAEVGYWVGQGVRGFKAKNIDAEHLQWLIEAAHQHGLTVTGHLGSGYRGSVNPRDAILMGIDRIEHFMGGDAMPDTRSAYASLVNMTPDMPEFQRIMELYKEHGTYFDATISAYGYYGKRDPEVFTYFTPEMDYLTPYARSRVEAGLPRRVSDQFEAIYWVKRDLIGEFYRNGGKDLITVGTDHPSWGEYFTPFSIHRELHALNLSGIPAADALRMATINSARALGVDDILGSIEVGKLADLVIVGGDPLQDIRNTRHVRTVVKNGVVFDPKSISEGLKGRLGPEDAADEVNW